MTKRIVLCADDYGQAEAVSRGILDLLSAGRLTAASCLVNQPLWPEHAGWLLPLKDKADIGLHLNFTFGNPLSGSYREHIGETFMSLPNLIWHTMTGSKLLYREALKAEVEAQIDAFTQAMGRLPRFIDGHQHVHHLPGIRDVLTDVYRERLKDDVVYMRAVTQEIELYNFFNKNIKNLLIHFTGGYDFAEHLDLYGIPHNTSFEGIYPFNRARRYRKYFQKFLRNSTDHGMIMCHPGLPSDDKQDPIYISRGLEFNYLKSPEFIADCERFNVKLSRFSLVI